jgi:hypothetical protein
MEVPVKATKIPITDSIDELARFWNTHELTEFEGDLIEVTEPVFERARIVKVELDPRSAEQVERIAKDRGIAETDLLRDWVLERLAFR